MSITRFHPPRASEAPRDYAEMVKGHTGDYVLYADHLVRIKYLEDEVKKATAKISKLLQLGET